MDFDGAKEYILKRLRNELNPSLFYHNLAHTTSVWESAVRLARMENFPAEELPLLETASLFHDSGMILRYTDHEESSVVLSQQILPSFGYNETQIEHVCRLIMVTRLPQSATTLSEEILCDADLDYLGREDFFIHSFELQLEWKLFGIKNTDFLEWLRIQEQFLSSHQYFTKSANQLRQSLKLSNLQEIKKTLKAINHF